MQLHLSALHLIRQCAARGSACSGQHIKLKENTCINWYRTQGFVSFLTKRMKGGSYPAVTDGIVRSFEFVLPPIQEQRLIVSRIESRVGAAAKALEIATAQIRELESLPAALLNELIPR